MRLHVKKCIHLMLILLALIETFTGAIIDCVVYTIFYQTSLENDTSSTSYYFTAHLLPTKHFYRLIIVLYVPILYLWHSRSVGWRADGTPDVPDDSAQDHSRVLRVIRTQIPQSFLPATAAWLSHWLRGLQATNSGATLPDNFDAGSNWWWLSKSARFENGKSWGALVHYRGQQHDSVIKKYNTRFALYRKLPWKYISRVYGSLTVREMPVWLRSPCLRLYIWFFRCRLEEAAITDLQQYRSLSEFFRRSLRPGIRPVNSASALTSPADGLIVFHGVVIDGELEQIKGVSYSLHGFIGPHTGSLFIQSTAVKPHTSLLTEISVESDASCATSLLTCLGNRLYQCVVYLSPGEYHHFHSPVDWVVTGRRHFPGELFCVNPGIVRWLQGLFNFNERVMFVGNWQHGFFSLTAVGATLVGSINVHFDKELCTNDSAPWPSGCFYDRTFGPNCLQDGDVGVRLNKGQEMGDFRLGSTIVLLFEAPPDFQFSINEGQKVKYGEPLVSINNSDI